MGQGQGRELPFDVGTRHDCLSGKTIWSVHAGRRKVSIKTWICSALSVLNYVRVWYVQHYYGATVFNHSFHGRIVQYKVRSYSEPVLVINLLACITPTIGQGV